MRSRVLGATSYDWRPGSYYNEISDPGHPDSRPFVQFLRDLAERAVEIYLTELDVNDCSLRSVTARDVQVETYMRSFVSAALEVPAVTMLSNWNFRQRFMLRQSNSAGRLGIESWAKCVPSPECPRPI